MMFLFLLKLFLYSLILCSLAYSSVLIYIKVDDQETFFKRFFGFYLAVTVWAIELIMIVWVSFDLVNLGALLIGGTL